jgi:anti-sigma regulatory factor (Ser/Thr protein kinase)
MGQAADFFVSYTSADRAWAEWIAWQLESEGYHVRIQAWDFTPGRSWAHEMQQATTTAERVVAVLTASYLESEHGEAEWQVFQTKDPLGKLGLLLPVRVGEVDPPGLLKTRIYVDLVGRDAASARAALLAAARGARGKPTHEPEFPGGRRPTADGSEVPSFPGDLPTVEGIGSGPLEELKTTLRADDMEARRAFTARISTSLRRHGFSDSDVEAFQISLRELVDNVANYVPDDKTVQLEIGHVPRWKYHRQEGLSLQVTDRGEGFDFNNALLELEDELLQHGDEHGLLRAYRLGSLLDQVSTDPHTMGWMRERIPHDVPVVFGEKIIPFVVSYRHEAIRIWRDVHTFFQFEQYLKRSQAFMELVFDPLQRPARKYIGIEIVGQGWTGALSWKRILEELFRFARHNKQFDKQFVLFADTGPSEQRGLRQYCKNQGIKMYEDASVIGKIKAADVSRASQESRSRKPGRK